MVGGFHSEAVALILNVFAPTLNLLFLGTGVVSAAAGLAGVVVGVPSTAVGVLDGAGVVGTLDAAIAVEATAVVSVGAVASVVVGRVAAGGVAAVG
jgi:hypothetical protein